LHHVGAAEGCDLLTLIFGGPGENQDQDQKIAAFGSSYGRAGAVGESERGATRESGRKAAGGGNPLPLFWHCRFADARKAPVYGLF